MKLSSVLCVLVYCTVSSSAVRRGQGHGTQSVTVETVRSSTGLIVKVGELRLQVKQDNDILRRTLHPDIREDFGLSGTVYTGAVEDRDDCSSILIINSVGDVVSGNIDCSNHHYILQYHNQGQEYLLHTRLQKFQSTKPDIEMVNEAQYCSLAIYTDPYFWNYIRQFVDTETDARLRIKELILIHVLAANQFYSKYSVLGESPVQFLLSDFLIISNKQCPDSSELPDYVAEVDIPTDDYYGTDESTYDYSASYESDPDFINDYDYGDWNISQSSLQDIISTLKDPFGTAGDPGNKDIEETEDNQSEGGLFGDYDYSGSGDEANILPSYGNCYEDINGTIDIQTEFCQSFGIDESARMLNLFSTLNHSRYCLAHLWTFRDLDVVGLADSPTEGAVGLSGHCAEYDSECSIGFNTGLISFRHLGNEVSLADSQETILHELGHSFGAGHDPRPRGQCSPGGKKGNYLMYPGPMGDTGIRRQFSDCSLRQIKSSLDETEGFCLRSLGEIESHHSLPSSSVEQTQDDSITVDGDTNNITEICTFKKWRRILRKLRTYVKDLRSYQPRRKSDLRDFLLNYLAMLVNLENTYIEENLVPASETVNLLVTTFTEGGIRLSGELNTYLVRKIRNLLLSISKCKGL